LRHPRASTKAKKMLGDPGFDTIRELQAAVERCFRQRVAKAKERRDRAWAKALAPVV
jgi:hypothetical protein